MNELVHAPAGEIAARFKESGLFPDLKSEAQAYVKVIAGQELGIGPMAAVAGLNVIQGKVTMSANLLATMVKRHPAYDYRVTDHTDKGCRIVFIQNGEEIGESTFTLEDAQRAGLRGQNWQKYPKAMLFARALTQGVRWYCPDVTSGSTAYVSEEIGGEGEAHEEVHAEVVVDRPAQLAEIGQLLDEFSIGGEVRDGIRTFCKDADDADLENLLGLLREGQVSAVIAGVETELAA